MAIGNPKPTAGASPNGVAWNNPTIAGNGSGENARNFRYNSFPPGSPSSPSSVMEILATLAQGLGFYPDALLMGMPAAFAQPFYRLNPPKITKAGVVALLEIPTGDGVTLKVPFHFSVPYRQKKLVELELGVVTDYEICDFPKNSKALFILAPTEIVFRMNGNTDTTESRTFFYCNFLGGANSLKITTTHPMKIRVFAFS